MTSPSSQQGFSLAELLIAAGIVTVVAAAACGFAAEAQSAWHVEDERLGLQQRVRVAADVLTRALVEAGAGASGGPARGPLLRAVPAIVPRRMGVRGADDPGGFRDDGFTVFRAIPAAEPAALLQPAAPGTTSLELSPAGCLLPACGIGEGNALMVVDGAGHYDVFTVRSLTGATAEVRHQGGGNVVSYAAGSAVLPVEARTIYLDPRTHTLRSYNGDASDLPELDDVVELRVEYYGEGLPPLWPRPAAGTANCLYDAAGVYQAALMAPLGSSVAPVRLTRALLTDGPWCGAGDTRFDADLLRVRRVQVGVRLQASDPAVRGTDPSTFRLPGTALQSARTVADVVWETAVTPRNLRQGW